MDSDCAAVRTKAPVGCIHCGKCDMERRTLLPNRSDFDNYMSEDPPDNNDE